MCTQNKNERISSKIVLSNCLVLRGEEIGVDYLRKSVTRNFSLKKILCVWIGEVFIS